MEQITPVSAPSMIGMESLSVPESRFTMLNAIVCPPSAQTSSEMMNAKSTRPRHHPPPTRPTVDEPENVERLRRGQSDETAPHT